MGSVAAADKSQSTKMDQSINLFTQDWPSHSLASLPPQPPPTLSLSPLSGWEISGWQEPSEECETWRTAQHTDTHTEDTDGSPALLLLPDAINLQDVEGREGEGEQTKLALFLCDEPTPWTRSCCCVII